MLELLRAMLYIILVLTTLAGFIFGGVVGGAASDPFGGGGFSLVGALVGGMIAFLWGLLGVGFGLLLFEIRDLLQRQVIATERAMNTQAAPAVAPVVSSIVTPMAPTQGFTYRESRPMQPNVPAGNRVCPSCGQIQHIERLTCWKCGANMA